MRLLLLSDTHLGASTVDRMPSEVWAMAGDADAVLHAGDVCEGAVLQALRRYAPVHAVLGNNDRALRGELPDDLQLELGGVRIAMVHDAGPTAGRVARMARRFPGADVVVFGHSHQPVVESSGEGPVLVNPGSPTQRRRQPVHTVAWLEVADGEVRDTTIVEVGPLVATR